MSTLQVYPYYISSFAYFRRKPPDYPLTSFQLYTNILSWREIKYNDNYYILIASCGGSQRGQRPFLHTTLLARCSVLYALSALPLRMSLSPWRARTLEAAGTWADLHPALTVPVCPAKRLTRRTIPACACPPVIYFKRPFFLKMEWSRKAILRLSCLDYLSAKAVEAVNGGAASAVHLDR